mmetsp:Transcript_6570/g.10432  ORF Transcript_6570/g.10432 Transcript_6570/m.10432 type:complete len:186 (+) Transcript_6570:52-609(+)
MFKKFTESEIRDSGKLKSSDQRKIRNAIADQYPLLVDHMEQIMPKKAEIQVAKCEGKINVVCIEHVPVFYNVRDGPYYPTLRVHHQYPFCMPTMRVDAGAIKFVLSGANIMCPGLTHKNVVDELAAKPVPNDTPVAILAEGKDVSLAIGHTCMDSKDIIGVNKGIGVTVVHTLRDGLWMSPKLEP